MAHRPHLFLPSPWADGAITVPAEVRHHIERVLRTAAMSVDYTDGAGRVGSGVYEAGVVRRGVERASPPPTPRVVVAVAAPQSADRQRFVVEKLAELGVDELLWLRTRNGGYRTPSPRRARAWAIAALEQSRGARLMETGGPVGMDDLDAPGGILAAHPGCGPLRAPAGERIVLAIGPEGGFVGDEVAGGAVTCFGLGARILRVETAAVAAASLAMHLAGRLQSVPDD